MVVGVIIIGIGVLYGFLHDGWKQHGWKLNAWSVVCTLLMVLLISFFVDNQGYSFWSLPL